MVEFALPKNSKISGGKTWPKPAGATETREFRVYRWNPDDGKNPSVDTYYVDTHDGGPMVLDGLIWIKSHRPDADVPPLLPRGVCGSCAMNIDGQNPGLHQVDARCRRRQRWSQPVAHQPVVKDRPRPDQLLRPYASIEPWLKTTTPTPQKEWKQSHEDRELDGLYSASCAPAARPRARLLVEQRALPRPPLLQATRWVTDSATKRPASSSTISRTVHSIAATPS